MDHYVFERGWQEGIFWEMIFSSPSGHARFFWRIIIVSEGIRPGKKKVPPQFFFLIALLA